ncbi:hypothetical protein AUP74_03045 [Microbulbifer aggregans]|uniref:Uncharacterized protein n=1 Tax=Microbulbifer aggregans TaxID=1769779 RepID=A0A1C9WB84_9GAMM|nr:hypothetical protein [Microbulbifer aggregans]AOS98411.1 hypothetical protein AUP74_03045 [Microbulbifer aggregans]
MMKSKFFSAIAVVAFTVIAVIAGVKASQNGSPDMADLKMQLESNKTQISELTEKIEKLEARLANVEVGLGKTQSELEWKVQPLASEAQ